MKLIVVVTPGDLSDKVIRRCEVKVTPSNVFVHRIDPNDANTNVNAAAIEKMKEFKAHSMIWCADTSNNYKQQIVKDSAEILAEDRLMSPAEDQYQSISYPFSPFRLVMYSLIYKEGFGKLHGLCGPLEGSLSRVEQDIEAYHKMASKRGVFEGFNVRVGEITNNCYAFNSSKHRETINPQDLANAMVNLAMCGKTLERPDEAYDWIFDNNMTKWLASIGRYETVIL